MNEKEKMRMEMTSAAERFIRRMVRCASNSNTGFRLKVRPGGCSGLTVEFDLANEPAKGEDVWTHSGLRIFLDSASCLLLNGSVVDFIDTRSLTGFVVKTAGGIEQPCSSASTLIPAEALIRR